MSEAVQCAHSTHESSEHREERWGMEHTEKGDEGRSEKGCLGVLDEVWGSEGVWVFRLSQTMRFAPFFFFFWISAWLGRFGRYRPIRTELARFGPRWHQFQPRRPDSGIATWHDAARTCGLRRPSCVCGIPPHRTRVRWPGSRVRASQGNTKHCMLASSAVFWRQQFLIKTLGGYTNQTHLKRMQ